jgi:extradiol dioxygenase family protein
MTLDIKKFHHIWLGILPGEEHEARIFYEEVLGAKEIERPEAFSSKGLWMELAGVQLHFGTDTSQSREGLQNEDVYLSERHFALVVSDAKAARLELEQKEIAYEEGTPILGMDRFSFRDPWNNKIEIFGYV